MTLTDEARELRNKRAREYYAKHKKQYAEANRRYWERQAAKARAEAETPEPDTPTADNTSGEDADVNG